MSCQEVARLIASDELADVGWLRRTLVRIHLRRCDQCRGYSAQLLAIGAAARDRWDSGGVDKASFEKLERSILERCLDASDVNTEDGRGRDPETPAPRADQH